MTQAELGKGLGTDGKDASKSVVYGWEKDQHYPRVDQLKLICLKLDCSADYLLEGVASTLPFSHALLLRINALPDDAVQTLENVMRAHLGMPAIPQMADLSTQTFVDPPVRGTTTLPAVDTYRGRLIDLTDSEAQRGGATGKTFRLSKSRRGGNAK